ncbi:Oidioi.mRNA.OKI2018_I69.XSR.g13432.t1.cds [Oikopleura dioica]|uniref:Oidioi.mRNA.OKI2018_I69.XSR.g13432.t1.cds n=1 Tax=Oikopleura dioica TaxID=34765 RepID=A0ABN7S6U9_OIKDI|nr:Oidioi.mRNA.OKI2018_I69.XSR.g13432.t1.cds [Oikopleura dioica]
MHQIRRDSSFKNDIRLRIRVAYSSGIRMQSYLPKRLTVPATGARQRLRKWTVCEVPLQKQKCKVQRPKGRCVQDPNSVEPVTTVAPVACLRLKPPLQPGFELDGPCIFPMDPGAECKIKCPKGKSGWGKCVCRQDEFGRADSDAIDYLSGPSCDFQLPSVCSSSESGTNEDVGCSTSGDFDGFSVTGDLVGPSTSCPMTCDGSANDDLRAVCRCKERNECEWVPKKPCSALAPECPDPSTVDFGEGFSVSCSDECKCKKQSCQWANIKGKCNLSDDPDGITTDGVETKTSCKANLPDSIRHLECSLMIMGVGSVFNVENAGSVPDGANCKVQCSDDFQTWNGDLVTCACSANKNKCKMKLKGECGLGKTAL